jgi:hypothetical protein
MSTAQNKAFVWLLISICLFSFRVPPIPPSETPAPGTLATQRLAGSETREIFDVFWHTISSYKDMQFPRLDFQSILRLKILTNAFRTLHLLLIPFCLCSIHTEASQTPATCTTRVYRRFFTASSPREHISLAATTPCTYNIPPKEKHLINQLRCVSSVCLFDHG